MNAVGKNRSRKASPDAQHRTHRRTDPLTRWLWGAFAVVAIGLFFLPWGPGKPLADPDDPGKIQAGQKIYARHCAACHGAQLEGQPNWRVRLPSGRMPAPPHDPSGHTWHHPDAVLFSITRDGHVPGRSAPPGYLSDMPAFKGTLTDEEIWAVLAYIKSTWPEDIRASQRQAGQRARR